MVIIMGTETYDGRERRYVDYPISDLIHMMGKASRQDKRFQWHLRNLLSHPQEGAT